MGIRVYFLKDNRLDFIEGSATIGWMNLDREEDWEGYRYDAYFMQMAPNCYNKLTNYLLMIKEEENSSYLKR